MTDTAALAADLFTAYTAARAEQARTGGDLWRRVAAKLATRGWDNTRHNQEEQR